MTIQLRHYQEDLVSGIRTAMGNVQRVLAVLPTGGGKCLAAGTPVMLHDGRVISVENVRVGDLLMGPDSQPRKVESLARGREALYRVTPVKGESYTVNESHILSLKMTVTGEIKNIEVRDYLGSSKTFKHCAKGWRVAVDFPPHSDQLAIPAYMLGVWLGDGNSRNFSITTGDPEIAYEVARYADSIDMKIRVEHNSPGSVIMHVSGGPVPPGRGGGTMGNSLRKYNLTNNKHIPHRYKTGSRHERLELLAGIIDTDGHMGGKGFDLTLKSERLMDDVIFVARSLGFSAYKRECKKTCGNNGKVGTYWRCHINGPVESVPCRVARKRADPRRQIKDPLVTGITVEPAGYGEYYGFEVSGNDRLFLLGDFTVTHNTVCFSYMASRARERGRRIGIFAHRAELLTQISDTLRAFRVPHQIIGPNTGQPDRRHTVFVCSAQTYARRAAQMPEFDLIIVDEAHHATQGSTWDQCLQRSVLAKVIGVTATPQRLDGRGLGETFQEMVIGPRPHELIQMGHLSKYRLLSPGKIDLSGVRMLGGDYNKGQVNEAVDKPAITGDIVKHYRDYLNGAPSAAFCVTVAHAQHVAEHFRASGYTAASIDGKMEKFERAQIVRDFREGRLNLITSAEILSEGFDVPGMFGAILIRPTKSLSLYLQQVGRALRTAPGKDRAIILDHVGNSDDDNHGLPCADRHWTLEGGAAPRAKGEVSTYRECMKCRTRSPLYHAKCPECGTPFPVRVREIEERDGTLIEQDIEERREKAKKEISPQMREQQKTRSKEGLASLFQRQMSEKLGRALTPDEMASQVRRAGHVMDARARKEW